MYGFWTNLITLSSNLITCTKFLPYVKKVCDPSQIRNRIRNDYSGIAGPKKDPDSGITTLLSVLGKIKFCSCINFNSATWLNTVVLFLLEEFIPHFYTYLWSRLYVEHDSQIVLLTGVYRLGPDCFQRSQCSRSVRSVCFGTSRIRIR
jgi:hypothetical protein